MTDPVEQDLALHIKEMEKDDEYTMWVEENGPIDRDKWNDAINEARFESIIIDTIMGWRD